MSQENFSKYEVVLDENYNDLEDEIEVDKNLFRDDHNRYITQGLFLEDTYNKTGRAVYSLGRFHRTYKDQLYPSLKQLYLEEGDVTEYLFAEKWLYDWEHWQRICKNKTLQPHIENWREELAMKLKAEGIKTLIELGMNTDNYQAAKFLAEEGWKPRAEKGRPTKDQVEQAAVKIAREDEETDEHYNLLKEHVNG